MTGNEILLNLERAEALKTSELCGGLIELSSRQSPRDVDWNTHPWIISTVQEVI